MAEGHCGLLERGYTETDFRIHPQPFDVSCPISYTAKMRFKQ